MVPAIGARWPPGRGDSGMRIKKLRVVTGSGRAGARCDDTQWSVAPGERLSVSEGRTRRQPANHRYADFQYEGEDSRAPGSRRPGKVSRGLTEPPSPTEPIPSLADRTSHRTRGVGHVGQGVGGGRTEPQPNSAHHRSAQPPYSMMSAIGQELPVPAQQLQVGYQSSNGQAQPHSNAAWPLLFF